MSQGTEYSGYGSHSAAGSPEEEEIWFVAVAPNDIQQMTLDQLDEAYSAGRITEQTVVWTDGMEQWAPLAEVANMSEEEEAAAPPPHQPAHQASQYHVSPDHTQGGPAGSGYSAAGYATAAAHEPISHAAMPGHQVISAHDLPAAAIHHAPGFQQSTAPVALSLEDEVPEQPTKPRRKLAVWLLAAAGVAAAGFTLVRSDLLSGGDKPAAKVKAREATLAAQPYEPASESKGASKDVAPAGADSADSKATIEAKVEAGGEAPIGSVGAAEKATEKGSEETAKKAKKSSLKSSFSGALKGKSKTKARKSRSRKRRTSRATRASSRKNKKKTAPKKKVTRTSSAFDPLNGSLP